MPIRSTSDSIADRAVQLLSELVGRVAVRYKVVEGHRFEANLLKEPTFCSQCDKMIFGLSGQRCKLCKLTSHKDCLASIDFRCSGEQERSPRDHPFEPTYFFLPTFCNHCGVLIAGITKSQGLRCSKCKMEVHFNCQQLVCRSCEKRESKNSSIFKDLLFPKEVADVSSGPSSRKKWSKIGIQDFELIQLLGTGSFSKVYLARLRSTECEFAIKVIKKTNHTVSDPESALTEMRALSHGRNYPFLTIAHCCFQSEDRLFFVMEYVIGHDLLYHLKKLRKFSEDRARFYSAEIVLAINYLHKRGLVYRDLKLENIIIESQGHCKLIDFGMSKELYGMKTRTFCGTPSYISPEVIRQLDYGYSVDWWALGVLMYEMLLGYSPFEAYSDNDELYKKILEENVIFPSYLDYLPRARSILTGLLEKDPHNRLGCQLLEDCEQAILRHPFFLFKTDDGAFAHRWEDLENKLITPPRLDEPNDQEYEDCDRDEISLTLIDREELKEIPETEFDRFSFYSESFRTLAYVK